MCRGSAWLEQTAVVTFGERCRSWVHELFNVPGNCFAVVLSVAAQRCFTTVGNNAALPLCSLIYALPQHIIKRFGDSMNEANIVSCGGVVIYRNKVLLLYKNRNGRNRGWVLPKGSLEPDETLKQAALREVTEESGAIPYLQKYLGKTEYSFKGTLLNHDKEPLGDAKETITKVVHWYLMTTNSFYCKPQTEEYFIDAGFYKQHEAYHLLKYDDERQIMRKAFIAKGKINAERKAKNLKNTEGMNAK